MCLKYKLYIHISSLFMKNIETNMEKRGIYFVNFMKEKFYIIYFISEVYLILALVNLPVNIVEKNMCGMKGNFYHGSVTRDDSFTEHRRQVGVRYSQHYGLHSARRSYPEIYLKVSGEHDSWGNAKLQRNNLVFNFLSLLVFPLSTN